MNLAALEPVIKAWATTITGVDVVLFQDEPRTMHNGRLVLLNVTSIVPKGIEELTQVDDDTAGAEAVTFTVVGYRLLSLSMQCETHDQRAASTARQVLERARTRARMPGNLATLQAAGLALVTLGAVTDAPYKTDGHWISRYVLDVKLSALSTETDVPVESIESVEGTGHIAGQDLPFAAP